jgi:hypothetical protein
MREVSLARYKTKIVRNKVKKNKPTWIIFTGVALLLLTVFGFFFSSREKPDIEVIDAPAIRLDREVFDYGDVQLGGRSIRTVVKVTNAGDQTLRFTSAPYIEVLEGC